MTVSLGRLTRRPDFLRVAEGRLKFAAKGVVLQARRAPAEKAMEGVRLGFTATRKIVQKQPMIPALKAITAHFGSDPQWKTVRPPLVELTEAQERELIGDLKGAGFSMPGLAS